MKTTCINIISIICLLIISCGQEKERSINTNLQDVNEFKNDSKISIDSYNNVTVENLIVLCKVWGFLKYYHPDIANGKIDWDNELFRIMPRIINSTSKKERNKHLLSWVKKYDNIEKTEKAFYPNADSVKLYPGIAWIEDQNTLGKVSKVLIKIKNAKRDDNKWNYFTTDSPQSAVPKFKNENPYPNLSMPDIGYRLLALFRYWNIIEYYYPYKYLIHAEWNKILFEFIPLFIEANDNLSYKLSLLKLITRINDTHARLYDPIIEDYKGKRIAPIEIGFVEGRAIIMSGFYKPYYKTDYPFRLGDQILKINNEPIESIVERKLQTIPASNYPAKLRLIARELFRTNNDKLIIDYERNGKLYIDTINTFSIQKSNIPNRFKQDKPCYQVLKNNISYIYPASIRGGVIPDSINTNGIIIDLRCYPSMDNKGYWEFNQLYPAPMEFAKFTTGNATHPGLFTYLPTTKVGNYNPHYFKGKKVILVNEITISHSEFMAMKYRCAPNSIVMGSTTAGADGGIIKVDLPGGISTYITGAGVYYPDGTETQQIGIKPDIEVMPTIKGIREGRDELLEKAIEYLIKSKLN